MKTVVVAGHRRSPPGASTFSTRRPSGFDFGATALAALDEHEARAGLRRAILDAERRGDGAETRRLKRELARRAIVRTVDEHGAREAALRVDAALVSAGAPDIYFDAVTASTNDDLGGHHEAP
ncbi:MAG: hypothetical protein JWQ18_1566 [Conexibacter sp.]|nr:hypothetical protein [Conexibacter sp.]